MKKVLSILLVVAAMLSVLSVGASAAQVMEGNASSTITFRQPSTYCIYIPETLTENETGMYQFTGRWGHETQLDRDNDDLGIATHMVTLQLQYLF